MADLTLTNAGFESGNTSGWTTNYSGTGASGSASASAVRTGSYGFRSVVSTTSDCTAVITQNNAGSTNYWEGECYVRFTSVTHSGTGHVFFLGTYVDDPVYALWSALLLDEAANTVEWWVRQRSDQAFQIIQTGLTAPASDAWTQVRFQFDKSGANTVHKLHYAGTEYTYTDSTTGTAHDPASLQPGWGYNTTTCYGSIDYDDVVYRDALTSLSTDYPVELNDGSAAVTGLASVRLVNHIRVPLVG